MLVRDKQLYILLAKRSNFAEGRNGITLQGYRTQPCGSECDENRSQFCRRAYPPRKPSDKKINIFRSGNDTYQSSTVLESRY